MLDQSGDVVLTTTVMRSQASAGLLEAPAGALVSSQAEAWQVVAKRVMDVLGALVVLLLVLPVLIVAAVGVRLSSEGPILFRQKRIGFQGRQFTIYKFRTFPADHSHCREVRGDVLTADESPLKWGRFLRRVSVDELPQIFNVLKGDMSLVGPRPEIPEFAEELARAIPGYRDRHRCPAGITGLAQIRGLCGPTSIEDRARSDNEYIEGWSIGSDLVILLRTVPAVIRKIHW